MENIYGLFRACVSEKSFRTMEDAVEEVLKCHFEENELLMVLKLLWVRKYFDKILDNLTPSQ